MGFRASLPLIVAVIRLFQAREISPQKTTEIEYPQKDSTLFNKSEYKKYKMPLYSRMPVSESFGEFIVQVEEAAIEAVEKSKLAHGTDEVQDMARILIMARYNDFVAEMVSNSHPRKRKEARVQAINNYKSQFETNDFRAITDLDLSKFDISMINTSVLVRFPNLCKLNMNETGIKEEQISIFGELKNLTELKLLFNEITKFPDLSKGFDSVDTIRIYLGGNTINNYDVKIKKNKKIVISLNSVPDVECYKRLMDAFGGVNLIFGPPDINMIPVDTASNPPTNQVLPLFSNENLRVDML